jgi:hypothetical protein
MSEAEMGNVTTDTGAEFPPAPVSFCARTVKVIVRHSEDCKDRDRGGDWRKCRCPKALLVYEGQGSGTNRRVSAKTRSWEQAEGRAQEPRDLSDPEKVELKRLRAENVPPSRTRHCDSPATVLLHDMGTGEGIPKAAKPEYLYHSTANKFRTPHLWGPRFRSRMMHDGKSLTYHQAIIPKFARLM